MVHRIDLKLTDEVIKVFFNKKTKGHPGQLKDNKVYCALRGDWIDTLVGCLEICDERGDYLNADIEGRVLNSAPSFNRAAKRAGLELPKDIEKAVNTCLYCEAIRQDKTNSFTEIPATEKINRKELLKNLYG